MDLPWKVDKTLWGSIGPPPPPIIISEKKKQIIKKKIINNFKRSVHNNVYINQSFKQLTPIIIPKKKEQQKPIKKYYGKGGKSKRVIHNRIYMNGSLGGGLFKNSFFKKI